MKNKIKWLFVTNYGRYALGLILMIVGGVFSSNSTIEFLSTDYVIFDYILNIGMILLIGQFLYHIIAAVTLNLR